MSSNAAESAEPSAEPAGEPAGDAATSADPANPVPAARVPDEADASGNAEPAANTAQAVAAARVKAASVAGDAGGATLVLDQEHEPDDPGDPDDPGHSADEPVSKLAIAALVTSVVALVPVAVACGVAALIGIRRSGRRGRGMATGALFLSAAWVIVAAAIVTVGALTHGFHKPVTVKYHEAAVFKLQTGDCVNSTSAQVVSVLPCYAPHEAEVFATFTLPATAWPGTAAVAADASSGCGDRLSGYLNPELAISLTQSYVYPDKAAWTAGTRTVICEVRATSGQLSSSVRGAS